MPRPVLVCLLAAALFANDLLAGRVNAGDVNRTLVASGFEFHLDSAAAPADPTITIAPEDILRLRIRNLGPAFHTFTMAHFPIDDPLAEGATIFVNITTTTGDVGKWQFWCTPHSSGSGEDHRGMVGWIQVGQPSPPSTPGFETLAAIAAIGAAFMIGTVWGWSRRRCPR